MLRDLASADQSLDAVYHNSYRPANMISTSFGQAKVFDSHHSTPSYEIKTRVLFVLVELTDVCQLILSMSVGWIRSENELIREFSRFHADNWYNLGVQLNVPIRELRAINSNYIRSDGVKRCLSETLTWWYNNPESSGGVTWDSICVALHAVDEKALAAKLARKHGKHVVVWFMWQSEYSF